MTQTFQDQYMERKSRVKGELILAMEINIQLYSKKWISKRKCQGKTFLKQKNISILLTLGINYR